MISGIPSFYPLAEKGSCNHFASEAARILAFLIGLRGKRENRAFFECHILKFAQNISVYAVRGKTVRHSVKKIQVFISFCGRMHYIRVVLCWGRQLLR